MLTLSRPVLLVGLPAAGKTTVGRMVAERLGCGFVDTDALVEEDAGRSITAIFEEEGEAAFRRRERHLVLNLLQEEARVIALGGGGFGQDDVRAAALSAATVFWLIVPEEVLAERIAASRGRPLFEGQEIRSTLRSLAEARASHFALAHHRVSAEDSDAMSAGILAILAQSAAAAVNANR